MSLLFDVDDHVATITLNRPEVLNAMNAEMYEQLSQAWIQVRDDPNIWVAVITGAGERSFSTGADLRSMQNDGDAATWKFWQTQSESLLNRGLQVWKPVIAAVNGYCLAGGMTLLLATDIRVAVEGATFGLSEVKRAILPANGGTQRAIRQLPYPIAMELLLTGDSIDAVKALQFGLVNEVVPRDELMTAAYRVAHRITRNGPLAVRAIKELAVRSTSLTLDDGLRMEQTMMQALRSTEDAKEGPRAFAERRDPIYKGQ
jgi:E-phenylitaconyl-CoA hydratase